MKQLLVALSLLFLVPGEIIANGRHCRRHCPRRMLCQPRSTQPVVMPVQPPVVPVIEPVQQIAAEHVTIPVPLVEPEVVVTDPETLVTTRMPLSRLDQIKDYLTYLPHAVLATIAGILGFGILRRFNARRANPQPVPPVAPQGPVAPQAPVAPQGPAIDNNSLVHLQQYPKGTVFLGQQQPAGKKPDPVPGQDPVPAVVEQNAKKVGADEPSPQAPRVQEPSQEERDGKMAAQQGYAFPVPMAPASSSESVVPEIALPDMPAPMPIPAAQPQSAGAEGSDVDVTSRQPSPAPSASSSVGSEADLKHGANGDASVDVAPVGPAVVQIGGNRGRQLAEIECSWERSRVAQGGPGVMKPHEKVRLENTD